MSYGYNERTGKYCRCDDRRVQCEHVAPPQWWRNRRTITGRVLRCAEARVKKRGGWRVCLHVKVRGGWRMETRVVSKCRGPKQAERRALAGEWRVAA